VSALIYTGICAFTVPVLVGMGEWVMVPFVVASLLAGSFGETRVFP
jgi:hypothetical protein